MIFKDKYKTVHCKDEYNIKHDFDLFYFNNKNNLFYYKGYLIHHEDGPAIEWNDGGKFWYLNGNSCEEEEYNRIMSLKKKRKILNDI